MKLKLDENLGDRGAELFRQAGHDVATVVGHGITWDRGLTLDKSETRKLMGFGLHF